MRNTLLSLLLLAAAQNAAADAGPYYVSYPGYCNVKKIYVNANGDIYGTEVGCASIAGLPLMGSVAANGTVAVAEMNGTAACLTTYWPNYTLRGGCSTGTGISYGANSTFALTAEAAANGAATQTATATWSMQAEMPDTSTKKGLPPIPF